MSDQLDPWDLLETLADGVIATQEGLLVYVNAATERLHGAPRTDLIGKPVGALISSCPMLPAGPAIEVTVLRRDGSSVGAELTIGSQRAGVTVATLRPTNRENTGARLDRLAPTLLRMEVAEALSQPGTIELILARATDAIVHHLGAARARIWLLDEQALTLRLVASSGRSAHRDGAYAEIKLGESRVGQIARDGRVFITNDLPSDPIMGNAAWAPREGVTAFAGYPLRIGGRVIGVCAAFSVQPLDGDILDALASVAVVIAQGVERLRTEESNLASTTELAVILGSIAEAVIGRDHEGAVVYANEAAAEIFGYTSKDDLIGTRLDELFDRVELRDESGKNVPRELMPGHIVMTERREAEQLIGIRTSATGQLRWFLTHAMPIQEGSVRSRSVTIYRDVTVHQRVERGLRFLADAGVALASAVDRSSILTAAAAFAVPGFAELCAIYEFDEASGMLSAAAVKHADPEIEARGQEIWRRFPPDPSADWGVGRALHTGMASLHPTMDAVYREAEHRCPEYGAALRAIGVHSAIVVPLLAQGRVFGVCVFGSIDSPQAFDEMDLGVAVEFGHRVSLTAEVSVLLDEAREGVRARDAFLSVASHELKTPITTLSLQAQGLERMSRTTESIPAVLIQERAAKIRRQTHRLTALVDRLLDVSRISYGRLMLHLEEVCLADLTREVMSRFDTGEAGVRITLHAEPSVVGQWDRVRLDEVITNLISNAIKYGRGQPIEIRITADVDRARLEVVDRGIGIAASDQPELFHRFQRFVSDRDYGGFGLGLWISHQIVEALGGTLHVDSRLGEGSTFTVELPRGGPSATTPATPPGPA